MKIDARLSPLIHQARAIDTLIVSQKIFSGNDDLNN